MYLLEQDRISICTIRAARPKIREMLGGITFRRWTMLLCFCVRIPISVGKWQYVLSGRMRREIYLQSPTEPHCIELTRNSNKRRTFNARKTPINNTWSLPTNFQPRGPSPRRVNTRPFRLIRWKFDILFYVSHCFPYNAFSRCVRFCRAFVVTRTASKCEMNNIKYELVTPHSSKVTSSL